MGEPTFGVCLGVNNCDRFLLLSEAGVMDAPGFADGAILAGVSLVDWHSRLLLDS